jgi:methionyl-tRNA synthetase
MTTRRLLVTSALPYANGPIHVGHLVEYIQTDIWVRFQKMMGHECRYMCADDTHGTPVMLSARRQGISTGELIGRMHAEHLRDFGDFLIEFDNYYSTDSQENRLLAEEIYLKARERGYIYEKDVEQYRCEACGIFLPDRFIRGTCPSCGAPDQYGDSCEACSATYAPTDLGSPTCAECGRPPVLRASTHHFFRLTALEAELKAWMEGARLREEIRNKLQEWFEQGLRDWDISRDAPYFGFLIPGTADKYFYVWMDAPIGYMASTMEWCRRMGRDFDGIWRSGDWEIYHFIGKDIMYFHTLFWPAMLMVAGFRTPTRVNVHGFLTVNGVKMSKSRGTFIRARTYLERLNPEFLRYYYAAKLTPAAEDLDLNLEDFVLRVNADVVNKLVNIGSRLGGIVNRKLEGRLSAPHPDARPVLEAIRGAAPRVAEHYQGLEYGKAVREVMGLADLANRYIDESAPWEVLKTDPPRAREICTAGLEMFRLLVILLQPILPVIARRAGEFLNAPTLLWSDLDAPLAHGALNPYSMLATRVTLEEVQGLIGS